MGQTYLADKYKVSPLTQAPSVGVYESVCSHWNAAGALSSWEIKWSHYFTFGKNLGKCNYTPRQTPPGSLCVCASFFCCCCDFDSPFPCIVLFHNFLFCMPTLFCHFPRIQEELRLFLIYLINYSPFPLLPHCRRKALSFYLQI